jgi:hypothetical protein
MFLIRKLYSDNYLETMNNLDGLQSAVHDIIFKTWPRMKGILVAHSRYLARAL